MKRISLLLFVSVCVAFAAGKKKSDYSDFEKSLMAPTPAPASQSVDSTASEGGDSSGVSSATSSMDAFEESLKQVSSEMEPVYRWREEVLSGVREKDTAKVERAVEELSKLQTRNLIPIRDPELEAAYIEAGMFGSLCNMLVRHYKQLLDTNRFDKSPTIASDDGLSLFTENAYSKRDTSSNIYYSIRSEIEHSGLPESQQKKLKILLLLRDAYIIDSVGVQVRNTSEFFLRKFPDDPDARWIDRSIHAPLSRMNVYDLAMKVRAEKKEDVIKDKLYTGGFGLNLYFLMGGLGIGFENLYRKDLFEPVDPSVNLEAYLQIWRIALLFELSNSGVEGMFGYGLGAGFVLYDSRYLKVRPYISFASTGMELESKKKIPGEMGGGFDEMYGFDSEESSTFTLAVDADFKFATAYFLLSDSKLTSFALVSKFGMSFIDVEDDYFKGSGITLFFHIGLGVYFW